jgi:large subunit ribosomal protein L14
MIQQQTILKVSDNSGAKAVKCIKVLNGFKKKYAIVGDTIVVSVQKLRNKLKKNSKVKKKSIYRALIIRTKIYLRKKAGFNIRFKENSVILLNTQGNPVGTRIIGPLPKELKNKNFQKIISISNNLI